MIWRGGHQLLFGNPLAGDIAHVDILKNPDGRSKGCAVVYFDHPDDAEKAIGMLEVIYPHLSRCSP